jgi:plastocyanin
MRRGLLLSALFVLAAVMPSHFGATMAGATTGELRGTVELVQDGRKLLQGVQEAVVFFTPAAGARVQPGTPAEIVTFRKEFRPRVLVVPAGTRVRFPNQDPILHNVFSVSGGNAFDLGLYGKGAGKEVSFAEPGLVRVFCNVHQAMTAHVLVLGTSWSVSPDASGAFHLRDLPPGRGTLSLWHERGELVSQQVTVPTNAPVRLQLPVSRPRVPRHLNKFGKPYRTGDAYR